MPDVVFASRGQQEALAAQEAVAKKGREIKEEFEQGAKSVGKWDAEMAKLQRSSESALRSVQTEQEKIAEQITLIQERQEKGIGTTEQNNEAIQRLRQRWVELDDATQKQREETERVKEEHTRLKTSAETALRSVQTEEEKVAENLREIEDQIKEVEAAMEQGLIPPDEAEQGIERLKGKMEELKTSVGDVDGSTGRLGGTILKAFDPAKIAKWATTFVGVGAGVKLFREEIEDLQKQADAIAARQQKGYQEALAAGDAARAGRLAGRVGQTGSLERGAQRIAESVDSPYLSAEELADLDELLANRGQGKAMRRFRGIGRWIKGGGGQRREDVVAALAEEVEILRSQITGYEPGGVDMSREREQLSAIVEMLIGLRRQGGAVAQLAMAPFALMAGPATAIAHGAGMGNELPRIVSLLEEQNRLLAGIERKEGLLYGTNE